MRFEDMVLPICGIIFVLAVLLGTLQVRADRRARKRVPWSSGWSRDEHERHAPRDRIGALRAHERRLEQIVQRFAGSLTLKIERAPDGKYRAWLGRTIFELAPLRASWSTRAGALRLLWRELVANGGLLTTMALENNPDAAEPANDGGATVSQIRAIGE